MVINFLDESIEAVSAKVDFSNKKIKILNNRNINRISAMEELKKIFTKSFYPQPYKIIFIFDSATAVTNYEMVALARDDAKKTIDESELENLVSQGLWRLFDQNRHISVKRFNIEDLEILLCDVRIYSFRVDGMQSVDLFKQKGRQVEIVFSQTFAKRSILKELISLLPKRAKIGFIAEGGTMAAHLLSRLDKKDKFSLKRVNSKSRFIFAKTIAGRTDIFLADEDHITLFDYFMWGRNNFYAGMAKHLEVAPSLMPLMIEKFISGQTSLRFKQLFSKILLEETITLIRGIKTALNRIGKSIAYLDWGVLPLKFNGVSTKMIIPVSNQSITENFGFQLNPIKTECDFLSLAGILEFYFLPHEDKAEHDFTKKSLLQHLAKRHLKWLLP